MSKLGQLLTLYQKGGQIVPAELVPLHAMTDAKAAWEHALYGTSSIYKIGVRFAADVAVSGAAGVANGVELQAATENARAMILEEVFGEFIQPLRAALQSIHMRNHDEAAYAINAVIAAMHK